MGRKIKACILGGGVRGCSIAAILAESGCFEVALLEKHLIGSGITSVNHGRLHSGASLWQQPSTEESFKARAIRRRLRGAELIRQALPDCFRQAQPGFYLVCPELIMPFLEACHRYGIPATQRRPDSQVAVWLHPSQMNWGAVEVPEYAFLPTELALRLATVAAAAGALILTNHSVQSVTWTGEGFALTLADQSILNADMVVNATGGGATAVNCELHQYLDWPLRFSYPEVRLLLVRETGALPPLDRPLAIVEPDNILPTLVPHSRAFVFHASPRTPCKCACVIDDALMETCYRFFPSFAEQAAASQNKFVSGIYPESERLPSSHSFRVHSTQGRCPYWVVSGGNATTTLLDACDTVEAMLATAPGLSNPSGDLPEWLARVITALIGARGSSPLQSMAAKMVWE